MGRGVLPQPYGQGGEQKNLLRIKLRL
jgi:hypothetical protein